MEERKTQDVRGRKGASALDPGHGSAGSAAPFFIGLVASLVVGWWLFPQLLFSESKQPIRFSHPVHIEEAGMACEDCHYFREDGSFSGLPTLANCIDCHEEPQGEDPEELKFVQEYVQLGKEVEWKAYQKQPDNVFFSHAAHSLETCGMCHMEFEDSPQAVCNTCHPDVASMDTPPKHYRNKLTTYSKETMKMWQCEECHANENHYDRTIEELTNNACHVCHK